MYTQAQLTRAKKTILRFFEHCQRHPEVYERLRDLAVRRQSRGRRHYGMHAFIEFLRFETDTNSVDETNPFKMPNDFQPLYVRRMGAELPEMETFFSMKRCAIDAALENWFEDLPFEMIYVPGEIDHETRLDTAA